METNGLKIFTHNHFFLLQQIFILFIINRSKIWEFILRSTQYSIWPDRDPNPVKKEEHSGDNFVFYFIYSRYYYIIHNTVVINNNLEAKSKTFHY